MILNKGKKPILLIWSILLLFLGFPQSTFASGELTVTTNTLNVRSGPGLEHDVVGQVSKSEVYQVLEEKKDWYKISFDNNKTGWVASWLVEYKKSTGKAKLVEAKSNNVNVRSGPGTSFQVISQINPEQNFPIVSQEGDWIQILMNQQKKGWVANWVVNISSGERSKATSIHEKVKVQADILNVRKQPDTSSSVIGKLSKGEEIEVIAVQNGWYNIRFGQDTGWVAGDYVTPSTGTTTQKKATNTKNRQVQVISKTLNVRSSSSLDAKVIDQLSEGDQGTVLVEQGDWLHISYGDKKGWVANWLVTDISSSLKNKPKIRILNQGTNIRSGAGTNHKVIYRAADGEQFEVVSTQGDWFEILLKDGTKGYVAGWIVSTEGIPSVERNTLLSYLKGKRVVIDPGHGGKDSGAIGSHFDTLEKILNLEVSNLLKTKFEAAGAKVSLTRTTDRFISLQNRVSHSSSEKADVFLSIHHNTHENSKINGTITYFYSNGDDRQLANTIQKELVKSNGLKDLKARQGNFYVLRENPQLAVLIELGFLTNYNDELTVKTSKFQENSSNGILHGVAKYFKEKR